MSYTEFWDYKLTHEWETVFNQPVFHEIGVFFMAHMGVQVCSLFCGNKFINLCAKKSQKVGDIVPFFPHLWGFSKCGTHGNIIQVI